MRLFRRGLAGPGWAWVLLGVILLVAARERFRLPLTPFADGDTWTYLRPGLLQNLGAGFQHSLGQSFLYPAFLGTVMRLGGDLRWVCAMQHAGGLVGGALLFLAWSRARIFFARWSGTAETLFWAFGLFAVVEEQFSLPLIRFEHLLRPEALFTPVAALLVWLLLEFGRARWLEDRRRAALLTGTSALFVAGMLFFLKPAFGLALLAASLPVLCSLGARGMTVRKKLVLVLLPAVALLVLVVLPEWRLRQSDPEAAAFLPETLFTVHADLIHQQMANDLARAAALPYPRPWLEKICASLGTELERSAEPTARPYPSLRFNPDYLKTKGSIIAEIREHWPGDTRQSADFCSYYYWRTFAQQPRAMANKIIQQLSVFYGQAYCPDYRMPKHIYLEAAYEQSAASFTRSNRQLMDRFPPTRTYLRQCEALRRRADLPLLQRGRAYQNLNGVLARAYLPLGLGCLVLLLVSLRWKAGRRPALLLVLGLHALSGGINLTLATTHSLDVTRYLQNQLLFIILAEGFTAALFFDIWCVATHSARQSPGLR